MCYDHLGHGYFLEDGAETGNLIAGNLGVRTRNTATGEGVLPTDSRAATFWITNPDNTVRGNVAAGSDGFGFWYALPASPTGLSSGAADPARARRRCASSAATWPTPTGGPGSTWTTGRWRTATPRPPSTRRGPIRPTPTRRWSPTSPDFTAYKHPGRAVWLRGRDHRLIQRRAGRQRHRRHVRVAARPSWRTRCSWARRPTTAARPVGGHAAARVRVLRRPGGRGPGDVRQLHRRRARSRRARSASTGPTASR